MFLDNETIFATAHSATAATGSNISTNTLDLGPLATGNTGRNLGGGEELWMDIECTVTATSTDSATVDFRLVTDDAATLATPVTLASTGAIAKATLVAGYRTGFALPNRTDYEQYIGINAEVGVTILTAGTFRYQIVKKFDRARHNAAAYTLDV